MTITYLPVVCQLVGNLENWTAWHSAIEPGKTFTNRWDAISWGIDELDHDDFRIATLNDGKLAAIGWGADDFDPAEEDLPAIARQLALELA